VTLLDLREGDPPVDVALDPETGQLLAASDFVVATPSLVHGQWSVSPSTKVGVVRVGDTEVWIRPKIDIQRIVFLLGYALNPAGWRDVDVPLVAAPDLLTAVAYAFSRQAERATQQGLLQGYRTLDEALPVLRGRLREADQMRQRFGLAIPLEVRYDEFTVDITENQLLRAAAERLLRLPHLSKVVRRALRRLAFVLLADVSALPVGHPLPCWQPTRLNARYHIALRLAELVLAAQSFEQQRGALEVTGFLFDMARIFEDFVSVAMREALTRYSGRVRFQHPMHLDENGSVLMRPDIVWLQDTVPMAVMDAKYKAERPTGFPQADLYQMLAYCTALRLDRGHLIYARGNEQPASYRVMHAGVDIVCHALDLDVAPEILLSEITQLAVRVARSGQVAA
jgi:5-methylcytosine-specific restriction enzyme subunit McrC